MVAPSGWSATKAAADSALPIGPETSDRGSASRIVRATRPTTYLFPPRSKTAVDVEPLTNSTPRTAVKGAAGASGPPGTPAAASPPRSGAVLIERVAAYRIPNRSITDSLFICHSPLWFSWRSDCGGSHDVTPSPPWLLSAGNGQSFHVCKLHLQPYGPEFSRLVGPSLG